MVVVAAVKIECNVSYETFDVDTTGTFDVKNELTPPPNIDDVAAGSSGGRGVKTERIHDPIKMRSDSDDDSDADVVASRDSGGCEDDEECGGVNNKSDDDSSSDDGIEDEEDEDDKGKAKSKKKKTEKKRVRIRERNKISSLISCDLCGKKFYKKHRLEAHLRSHQGLKVNAWFFVCS